MSTTTGSGITRYGKRRLSAEREREEERYAPFWLVLRPYMAAVSVDDPTTDREAQAGTLCTVRDAAVKLLEYARFVPGAQTRAPVSNLDGCRFIRRGRENADRAVLPRIFR